MISELISIKNAATNMAVRSITLLMRFAMTLYIAKYLGIEAVGTFGLMTGIASITPIIVGFGANYFMSREAVQGSKLEAGRLLRDRLLLSLSGLCAGIGIYLVFNAAGLAPLPKMIGATIAIVVLETLSCDIAVWLIARRMAIHANIMLFIRIAAWNIPIIIAGILAPSFRDIKYIIYAWVFSEALQYLYLYGVLRDWPLKRTWQAPVDFTHLCNTVKNARFVYFKECTGVLILYIDRFIVNNALGLELTGIFTLYWSIANGVNALVLTGVIMPAMPDFVASFNEDRHSKWVRVYSETLNKTLVSGFGISTALLLIMYLILPVSGIGQFQKYWLFSLLLFVGNVFNLLSITADFGLASRRLDREFASIGITGLIVSLVLNIIGIHSLGIEGAAYAAIVTHALLFALKSRTLNRELAQDNGNSTWSIPERSASD